VEHREKDLEDANMVHAAGENQVDNKNIIAAEEGKE
jgi:hypothetical protein